MYLQYVVHGHMDMCMRTFTKKRKSRWMGQIHIIGTSPPVLFMIDHIESCCFVLAQWHQSGQVPLACKKFDPLVILARGYGRLNLLMFLVWQRSHRSPNGSFMLQLSRHRLKFRRKSKKIMEVYLTWSSHQPRAWVISKAQMSSKITNTNSWIRKLGNWKLLIWKANRMPNVEIRYHAWHGFKFHTI